MKKLILPLLFLTLINCSKDDEVAYCYRCDSYANNTLGTSGETEELCRGRDLQDRILIITWMLSEVIVETVQKFNRI